MSEQIGLDGRYKAAESDSMLSIRFLGNTSRIAGNYFHNVDAFQMFALALWLKREANKMLDRAEALSQIAIARGEPQGAPQDQIFRP